MNYDSTTLRVNVLRCDTLGVVCAVVWSLGNDMKYTEVVELLMSVIESMFGRAENISQV
jgi:hypothetical protein